MALNQKVSSLFEKKRLISKEIENLQKKMRIPQLLLLDVFVKIVIK